jgi:hypothetical protein
LRIVLPHHPEEIPMLRIGALLLSISGLFVITTIQAAVHAQTATVPAYFFKQWTVQSNCIEQGFDPAEQTQVGLQYAISTASLAADGLSYAFQPINSATQAWPDGWSQLTLQYRAGIQMADVPADFACVPGEPTSALLANSHFTQSAEPYYEYEHWYGLGTLHGEPHHFLIFPRNIKGADSAIIILLDAGTNGDVQLDQNGTIHSENY